jgi:hypothetical protein
MESLRAAQSSEAIMTGRRIIRAVLCAGVLEILGGQLDAQGVTGAAVQGTVVGVDSQPLAGATVRVNNPATGERWQAETLADGRFYLDHLSVGGPYTLVVRAIGYTPATQDSINLSLGQRLSSAGSPTQFHRPRHTLPAGLPRSEWSFVRRGS